MDTLENNYMQWTAYNPGLLIILVDQSISDVAVYNCYAVDVANEIINRLIQINFDGKKAKNRCFIEVISYGKYVKKEMSAYIQDFEERPVKVVEDFAKVSDGAGGYVNIKYKKPVWINREDDMRGETNLKDAFEVAKEDIEVWRDCKPNSPSPVIINISNGLLPSYNGEYGFKCLEETIEVVNAIKAIESQTGKIQITNVILGDCEHMVFPSSNQEFESVKAKFFYEISTNVNNPDSFVGQLFKNNICKRITTESKLCCNENVLEYLWAFLDYCQWGYPSPTRE